jgi:hypothetical protein
MFAFAAELPHRLSARFLLPAWLPACLEYAVSSAIVGERFTKRILFFGRREKWVNSAATAGVEKGVGQGSSPTPSTRRGGCYRVGLVPEGQPTDGVPGNDDFHAPVFDAPVFG